MLTAIVQFHLAEPMTVAEAKREFSASAPLYQTTPGLVRKYYLLSQDGLTGGGVYLWTSLADANRAYSDEWRQRVAQKYGSEPTVTYFHTPVTVDNTDGSIQTSD
jgi:hypothetical protein